MRQSRLPLTEPTKHGRSGEAEGLSRAVGSGVAPALPGSGSVALESTRETPLESPLRRLRYDRSASPVSLSEGRPPPPALEASFAACLASPCIHQKQG